MLPFYSGRRNFDEFSKIKDDMQKVSVQFEDFLSSKSMALHKAKQQHNALIRELAQQKKKLQDEKNSIKAANEQNENTKAGNLQALKHKQQKVDELLEELLDLRESKMDIQTEIDEVKFDIERLERSFNEVQENMSIQNKNDLEELSRYEAYTGLKVEAVANDHLRFRFSNINPNDANEEVYCHLYVGGEDYKVGESHPPLSAEQTLQIEADLNRHGEIMLFLKQIRNILRSSLRIA